jgi:hypothetical protein
MIIHKDLKTIRALLHFVIFPLAYYPDIMGKFACLDHLKSYARGSVYY